MSSDKLEMKILEHRDLTVYFFQPNFSSHFFFFSNFIQFQIFDYGRHLLYHRRGQFYILLFQTDPKN
jgi:hypothetical protein